MSQKSYTPTGREDQPGDVDACQSSPNRPQLGGPSPYGNSARQVDIQRLPQAQTGDVPAAGASSVPPGLGAAAGTTHTRILFWSNHQLGR